MQGRARFIAAPLTGAILLVAVSGCGAIGHRERGAVMGAATGAAAGAVIGTATGATARGVIVGAVLGGTAGAVIGHQMDQKAKAVADNVPGATVTRVGEGFVVIFESGVLFDFDSDRLRSEARTNLDHLATQLRDFGDSKLLLVGHTDAIGNPTYNQQLSERRAIAVASYMMGKGVPSNRITITGRGEAEPIAPNDTDAGRQMNRRVEIAVFAGDEMKAAAIRGGGQ